TILYVDYNDYELSTFYNSGLTTGQLITEYLRSTSTYASKHSMFCGIHSSTNLSHKDDDDIPSATTLGNESTSDKIGYNEAESRDF
ncbi:9472_t:CDS:2, partial [Cetraspora pellucida]